VLLENATFTYNKTEQTAIIKQVTAGTLTVPADCYEVTGDKATNVGNYTLTVTGKGNFKGSATGQYSIVEASANLFTMTLDQTEFTYDGTEKKPTAIVKDGNQTLTTNVDYTLTFENNINAGTGKVIATGKGNYAGTKTAEFTIVPAQLTEVVLENANFTYNKTKQIAKVKHVTAGTLTVPAEGYEVSGDKATNVGNYTLTVTGKGNFKGQATGQYSIVAADANLFTLTLGETELTYDGTEKKPIAIVKDGEQTLTIDIDYKLTYENNINAGTGKVIATGKGNYSGTKTAEFTIKKADAVLSSAPVPMDLTYNAQTQKLVKAGTAMNGTMNYSLDNSSWKTVVPMGADAKEYTVYYKVAGDANHNDTQSSSIKVTIDQATLTEVLLENANFTYNKTEQTAIIKHVTAGTLTVPTDSYEVSGDKATNVGNYTLTATGKGNFKGSATGQYSIVAADAKLFTLTLGETEFTYDGTEKKPAAIVKDGEQTLTIDVDYTLTYENNINAGTGKAIATGKGNYAGTKTAEFTIKKADAVLSSAPEAKVLTYDTKAHRLVTPGITADGTMNYSLDDSTWKVEIPQGTNANTYKVYYKVLGDANHNDTKSESINVTIEQAELTEVVLEKATLTYNKAEQTAEVKHVTAGTLTVPTESYEVSGDKATNVGNYTLTVTGKGNYKGSTTGHYSIVEAGAHLFTLTLEQTEFTYDGTEKKPAVTAKDEDHTLVLNTDYTLTYENNVNAGTGKVIATGIGNYSGTKTAEFTIYQAELTEVVLEKATYTYNKKEQRAIVKHVTAGTLIVPADGYEVSGDEAITIGNYTLTVTGKGNFKGQVTGKYSIVAADAKLFTLTLGETEFTYDGTAKKPAAIVKDGEQTLTIDVDYTLEYLNNVNAGTAKVIATGKGNYAGTKTAEFIIKKADITTYTAPKGKKLNFTGVAQELIEPGAVECGAMLYSLNKEGEYLATIPQAAEAGEYTVYYIIKGDANHNDIAPQSVTASISGLLLEVAAGEYATFYYTKNLMTNDEDAELYTISSVNSDKVTIEKIEGIVPAETPILVKNTSSNDKTIVLIPTEKTPNIAIQKADEFKGTAEAKQMAASSTEKSLYVCNGKEFVRMVVSGTLAANRCWLEIAHTSAAAIRICEQTTDIRSLTPALSDGEGDWYDINGRKLSGKPSQKGLYVRNGKKVVVK
ncbi:MAG: MBG domain-containing protein, partial [Prevotella sp.]|nr:MBG domain-containing protein [Prevotella sp.]